MLQLRIKDLGLTIEGTWLEPRIDALYETLERQRVTIPPALEAGTGLRLVQAFRTPEPDTAIPIDQVLLGNARGSKMLMLPLGSYRVRTIGRRGAVIGEVRLTVEQ